MQMRVCVHTYADADTQTCTDAQKNLARESEHTKDADEREEHLALRQIKPRIEDIFYCQHQ